MTPITPFGQEPQSQYQPVISTSSKDCVPCSTRKGVRRSTVDATAPTTAQIRSKSGAPSTRGLTYGEAAEAAAAFGVKAIPSYANDRAEMVDIIDAGHSACLSIDCSATVNTERRTNTYTGDHTVYVHDVRWVPAGGTCLCEKHSAAKGHDEYLIEDSGNSSIGYQWWSDELVYKAAERRTEDRNGVSHGINLLVFPDTEGVSWKAVTASQIRSNPSYSTGSRLGTLKVGATYKGGRTERGGGWRRANRSLAYGWVHIQYAAGKWGWVKGSAVKRLEN